MPESNAPSEADAPRNRLRVDDLAHAAGVPTTTIRLYRHRGLLHPPTLEGRTGYYDESHLARLRLIGRLQDQGHSLAGIGALIDSWEAGRDLGDLVGVEQELDRLLHRRSAVELDPAEVFERFAPGGITAADVQRAAAMGLVEGTEDGRIRVPDSRFLDTGAALTNLGVPGDRILDEWEHLLEATDTMAGRFVALFEDHLLPAPLDELNPQQIGDLAASLGRLRDLAGEVVAAALDTSIGRVGTTRLAELLPDGPDPATPAG